MLSEFDSITQRVQDFGRHNRTIYVGFCTPAMIWKLSPLFAQFYPNMPIQTKLSGNEQHLLNGLVNVQFQLAVTHIIPDTDKYCFVPCRTESLVFSIPPGHKYADRASLSLEEMNGKNMLQLSDLGIWADVHDKYMPNSRFLTQNARYAFTELLNASILPSFNSDLAELYMDIQTERINIPIKDEAATVKYYLVCIKENYKQYAPLYKYFEQL